MDDVFEKLKKLLTDSDHWCDQLATFPLSEEQKMLADTLRRYILHCRLDRTKRTSAAAARKAIERIKQFSMKLHKNISGWN
jgi:hypothetical protein